MLFNDILTLSYYFNTDNINFKQILMKAESTMLYENL